MIHFRGWPKPSQWPCGRCRTWFVADGKASIERWYLSPYVENTLNSKVIKTFVAELRSRKCLLCFGIPMLYMCVMDIMNVLHTGMNMSISRIHVWLRYTRSTQERPSFLCLWCFLIKDFQADIKKNKKTYYVFPLKILV